MSELRSKIAGLSVEERSKLEKRLLQKRRKTGAESLIPRRTTVTPSPSSFTQKRIWFLDQFEPGSSVYNIASAVRLEGELNVEALQASLNALVARHETLRTRFEAVDGDPVQVIAPTLQVSLPVADLGSVPEQERDAELQRQLQSETDIPFDLARGPLLRARLLRLEERTHVLALTVHHIISDGWSMGVLMRELSALYGACCLGEPSPLPELPIQYADYAIWQRERLQGEVLDKQLSYWLQQLKDLPVVDLPTDRPRPAMQTFRGAQLNFDLPAALTESLEKVSQRAGVTLFMTLLAAFQTLLQRYSGQDDIAVGTPIAGRNKVEVEGLIGFFANTLVLRADLSGDPTFMELLGRVREMALGAYTHQDLPFDKLVEDLHPERDMSRNPLFQIAFALRNMPSAELDLPGIKSTLESTQRVTAKFDLMLSVIKTPNRFGGLLEYNSDLFDAATIGRMAAHFRTLLEAAMADPDQPITHLPLLVDTERHQLLIDWNATAVAYPREQCIQALFEAQVSRTPEAVAVVCGEQRLSYGELNARANRLAHYLIERGVGPDQLVALCLERSLDLVVAVVGILKAGGAYAPLDPGYPQERLAFMLEDTRAPVLITQSSLRGVLPATAASVLCVDEGDPLAGYAESNPALRSEPHHLAYINYTSGSTGKPKGVSIPHRGVTRLVFGANYVTLDAGKTLLQMAPISFDAATFELWGALLHGGRCVLYPDGVPTPEGLKAIIAREGVDTLWLTAAFFNVVVDTDVGILRGVKQLLTGGEALSVSHVRRALEQLQGAQLINGYGPTESTTFTCCYPIPERLDEGLRSIPIGRPISNTQVYILDTRLEPVPIGVVGELYIGGDGLARGYLNRAELTAERFISNPLPGTPGERLYKSGDRVRYLADGTIEFMGRSDDQVKIRGFRIEPGEIESVLAKHSGIKRAVVVAREDMRGDKRLVAYIVPDQGQTPKTGDLRHFLQAKVPDYLVPSAFVLLEALPLTPTGKVDHKALPLPDQQKTSCDTDTVGPRNVTEETLASIWCKLLGLDTVSIYDDFFALGGHSLLSVRLLDKIEKTFGRKLSLATLFQAPTIDALARALHDKNPDVKWSTLMAIQPNGSRPPLFFASGSTFKQIISRHLGPDQPFFGFEDFGVDGRRAAYIEVEDIAACYIKELRSFKQNGPYCLAGFCFGGLVAYEMARQLEEQGEKIALLALIDTVRPGCPKKKAEDPAGRNTPRYRKFIALPHRDKPVYLVKLLRGTAGIIKSRLKFYSEEIMFHMQNIICNMYLTLNIPIPISLRDFYVVENFVKATQAYKPKKYKGSAVLFRSDELMRYDDAQLCWGGLLEGGVKVRRIPGSHMSMIIDDENVVILAEELSAEIEQVRLRPQ